MGITATGMAQVAKLMCTDVTDTVSFDCIAIGTDNTAFAVGQTALIAYQQEAVGATVVGTRITTTQTNDTMQLAKVTTPFSFGSNYAIQEAGVFTTSHTGIMLCRSVFGAINVTSSDTLAVTITVQVKQGT